MEVKFHQDRRVYCLGSEHSRKDAFGDSTKNAKTGTRHLLSHLYFHLSLLSHICGLLVNLKDMQVEIVMTNEL